MNRLLLAVSFCVASTALAQGKAPAPAAAAPAKVEAAAPAMDLSKMGPWTRKPADEKKTKKEVEEFFKKDDEAAAKGDMDASLAMIDFPVMMVTDDLTGKPEATPTSKEEYIATMKPFFESMPKDMKYAHKRTITVLSDSLANVTDDFTVTTGKQKLAGRGQGLLVKVGGNWKWKVMTEAGWGGTPAPAAAPPAPAPAPAPTPAPAPAPKK